MKKITAIILSIMVAMMFTAVNVVNPAEAFADGTVELFYNGMDEQYEAEVSIDGTIVTYNGVTYDMNGGKAAWDDSEESYQLTREGSDFKNWNTEKDESGTAYSAGLEVEESLVDGQTLYAIWSVSADADDDEDSDEELPAKKGADADDADKDADVDDADKDADAGTDFGDADKDADLSEGSGAPSFRSANGQDNGSDDVSDEPGQEPADEPEKDPAGQPAQEPKAAPAPQQQETFAFLEMKGSFGEGQASGTRLDAVDQILFGGVVFDPNGGSSSVDGTEYEFIPPESEDKTFILSGWNTEEDGSGEAFAPGDTVGTEKVQELTTVYAVWTEEASEPAPGASAEDPAATPDDPALTPEDPEATPEDPTDDPAATPDDPAEDPAATPDDPAATPEDPEATPEEAAEIPEINSVFSVEVNRYETTHNETYYYQPIYFERNCYAIYDRMGYTNVTYVPCDYVHPSFRCLTRQGYTVASVPGESYDEVVEIAAEETGYYDNDSTKRSSHNPQTGENRVWMMYLVLLQGVAALLCVIIILRRYVL